MADIQLEDILKALQETKKVSKQTLSEIEKGLNGIGEALKVIKTNTSELDLGKSSDVKKLNEELERSNKLSESRIDLDKDRKKTLTDLQKIEKQEESLTKKLSDLRKGELDETIKLRAEINKLNAEKRKNAKSILESTNAYKKLSKSTNEAQLRFKELAAQFGVNSKQAQAALSRFNKLDDSLRKINEAARDGRRDVGRYGIATKDLGKNFLSISKNLVGALGVVGGLQLFASVIRDSFNIIREFGKEQSKLAAILGTTKSEISELTQLTKDLGSTTVFTASEATKGATELAKAGFSQSDILESLAGTLQLAAAGNVSLSESADIASNVLSGFGLKAKDTQRVVDVLAKAASSANVTIPSLGESFKEIASTAAILDVSLEEVGAVINTLGNAGIRGTKATNTLQSSLLRLSAPPEKATKAMRRLNLEFFDADGQFIGMTKTIEELEDKFKDLTKEQQLAATAAIFGKNSANQWLTTLNSTKEVLVDDLNPATRELLNLTDKTGKAVLKGSDVLKLYTAELENATGAGQRMSDEMLDNLDGDIKLLQSTWEGFILSLEDGESVMGNIMRSFIQGATDAVIGLQTLNVSLELLFNDVNELSEKSIRTLLKYGETESGLKVNTVLNKGLGDRNKIVNDFVDIIKTASSETEKNNNISKKTEEIIKLFDKSLLDQGESQETVNALKKVFLKDLFNEINLKKDLELESEKNQEIIEKDLSLTEKTINSKRKKIKQERELTGLIEKQRKVIADLNTDLERADSSTKITQIQSSLVTANQELEKLLNKESKVDNSGLERRKQEAEFTLQQIDLENQLIDLEKIKKEQLESKDATLKSVIETEQLITATEIESAEDRRDQLLKNTDLTEKERQVIIAESQQEINKIIDDSLNEQDRIKKKFADKEIALEDKKIQKAKETQEALIEVGKNITNAELEQALERNQIRQDELNEEINRSQQQQGNLEQLLATGNAQEQAFAQEALIRQQQNERKRTAELRKEKRQQALLQASVSAVDVLASFAGQPNASAKTLAEVAAVLSGIPSLVSSVPGFYSGTETTVGDALGNTNTKDGHFVRIDDKEAVFNGKQTNDLGIGKGRTTSDIVDIVRSVDKGVYKSTQRDLAHNVIINNQVQDDVSREMITKLETLNKTVKDSKTVIYPPSSDLINGVIEFKQKIGNTTTKYIRKIK